VCTYAYINNKFVQDPDPDTDPESDPKLFEKSDPDPDTDPESDPKLFEKSDPDPDTDPKKIIPDPQHCPIPPSGDMYVQYHREKEKKYSSGKLMGKMPSRYNVKKPKKEKITY
jgi:hypothetical protein